MISSTSCGITITLANVGKQGPSGVGVPAGGTAGQVLAKIDGINYNTQWVDNDAIIGAPAITPPVLLTDFLAVVRGGVVYLATVAQVLAASGSGAAELDFSKNTNSMYMGVF